MSSSSAVSLLVLWLSLSIVFLANAFVVKVPSAGNYQHHQAAATISRRSRVVLANNFFDNLFSTPTYPKKEEEEPKEAEETTAAAAVAEETEEKEEEVVVEEEEASATIEVVEDEKDEESPEEEEEETAEVKEEVVAVVEEEVSASTTESADSSAEEGQEEAKSSPPKRFKRVRHTCFVGNLPFDATDSQVRDLFAQHGTVELVSVPRNKETGQPRGFAFVDMSSEEEVQACVEAVGGSSFEGRQLRVTKSVPKGQVQKKELRVEPEGTMKIYVGNIRFETSKEELLEHYSQFGEIIEVYIPLDKNTGNGRGFAFVTMKKEDAEKAIEETNGTEFQGRRIVVSVPLPPGSKAPRRRGSNRLKLYIGNLSFYTVAETLAELFEEFGTVHDCYLPEDSTTGGSRGFGFVTMDKNDALNAVDELDGCELDGREIRVNEAQPKRRRSDNDDFESEAEESGFEVAESGEGY